MNYRIEKREDEYFAITDEKYKNKVITVNLSTVFKVETVKFKALDYSSYSSTSNNLEAELVWYLRYSESEPKTIYIDLNFNASCSILDRDEYASIAMSLDLLIEEAVDCIKNNKLTSGFMNLNKAMNEAYYKVFISSLTVNKILLFSDIILPINSIVYDNDKKILGFATRIVINNFGIKICEYVGKNLNAAINPEILIVVDDIILKHFISTSSEPNLSVRDTIDYYEFKGIWHNIYDGICEINSIDELKIIDQLKVKNNELIPQLNTPLNYTNAKIMYEYIVKNNTSEELNKYRFALKPCIKLVNINQYMTNEYMIVNNNLLSHVQETKIEKR